ncbi:MAG: ferredoxin [Chitinispirillaceae bacterium]|jgi:ferredoxin|nr:ferredoxin [Chitinispirillaceae bacterium]
MKVKIDAELCIGCELCTVTCPEVFSMAENGKAVVKIDTVPEDITDSCRQALDECPVEAISIST